MCFEHPNRDFRQRSPHPELETELILQRSPWRCKYNSVNALVSGRYQGSRGCADRKAVDTDFVSLRLGNSIHKIQSRTQIELFAVPPSGNTTITLPARPRVVEENAMPMIRQHFSLRK